MGTIIFTVKVECLVDVLIQSLLRILKSAVPIICTSGNRTPLGAEQKAAPTSGSPAVGEMGTVLKGSGLGRLDLKELRKRTRHPVPPVSLSSFKMGSGRNTQEGRLRQVHV